MKELKEILHTADVVILGRIIKVTPEEQKEPHKISEHDPVWHIATVEVLQTLKGKQSTRISVRFPNSMDAMWYRSPKFMVGQEMILILNKKGKLYTALESLQVQSKDNTEEVQRLLRND